jgi:nucleoside-diphosphate-sugar epimerase
MVTRGRALVLGDAGFVGRHLAATLDRRGWHVAGLDSARSPAEDLRRRLPSLRRRSYELVAHCAAVIGGRAMIEGCPLCLAENLELDAVVLRWCADTAPGRLLYLSSSAVYPVLWQTATAPTVRLREGLADPTSRLGLAGPPDRTYGWGKLAGEALCAELAAGGVPTTVVRPFSGYGSDQAPAYPFGAFADRALALADPFQVWGSGRQVRDFIHIDDLVAGALAAVEQGVAGPLNLCTGVGTSFDELARLFAKAAGYAPTLAHEHQQPAGVAYRVGDPTAMAQVYQPRVGLEDGVRRALAERAGHRLG